MLVVITLSRDDNMHTVIQYVNKPVVRIDWDRDDMSDMSFSYQDGNFVTRIVGVDPLDITAVWFRIAYLSYFQPANEPFWLFNRLSREEMIRMMFSELGHANWVSNPFKMQLAENKILQMRIASEVGFEMPKTLITGSADEAEEFRASVGNMVVKPLVHQAVKVDEKLYGMYTARVTPSQKVKFDLLSGSPAIFQEEIDRQFDIRTIVVGDRVFSLEIYQIGESVGGVDYRKAKPKDLIYKPHYLPLNLEEKCVKLVKQLGLQYGALDFLLGKDNSYYFLENNPSGAWKYVADYGDHPIQQAFADLFNKVRLV